MLLKRRSANDSPLNEDLNIMPVLDILSTLVVFLLLTAVWYQVGSFSTQNAVGDSAPQSAQVKPSLVATFNDNGTLTLEIKDLPKNNQLSQARKTFNLGNKDSVQQALTAFLSTAKQSVPELTESLVIPQKSIPYEKVMFVMDQINKNGIRNIGLGYRGS